MAGVVATCLGLALTELAAGIFCTPSLIGAVAGRIVTVMPGTVDSAVISVLDTSDKSVLVVLIVLVALGLGAVTAQSTLRRGPWVAWAVFGIVGALGVAATAPEPHADVRTGQPRERARHAGGTPGEQPAGRERDGRNERDRSRGLRRPQHPIRAPPVPRRAAA